MRFLPQRWRSRRGKGPAADGYDAKRRVPPRPNQERQGGRNAGLRSNAQRRRCRRDYCLYPPTQARGAGVSIGRGRVYSVLWIIGIGIALFFRQIEAAPARSLEVIQAAGVLRLCAHPNSLPFASKAGHPPGFQIELGEALAEQMGLALVTEWIVVPAQIPRADCDIVLDAIADPEAQADSGLRISRPYYRSGVGLAVPRGSAIIGFTSLNHDTKVGVQVGSV